MGYVWTWTTRIQLQYYISFTCALIILNGYLLHLLKCIIIFCWYVGSSLVAQMVKCLPTMWETWVQFLGWEDLLEKEMATHFSTLAWKILWTEEPGRLPSMGSQRVGHDWVTSLTHSAILFQALGSVTFTFRLLCLLLLLSLSYSSRLGGEGWGESFQTLSFPLVLGSLGYPVYSNLLDSGIR